MATLTRFEPHGLELPPWMARLFDGVPGTAAIRVEEYVEDGTLVVRAELPGFDIDKDVEVAVRDGMLHIKAERSESSEKKDKTFYRSEFRYGTFERMLPLPARASADDVKATYHDGVLEVRIPQGAHAEEAHTVPVQRTD